MNAKDDPLSLESLKAPHVMLNSRERLTATCLGYINSCASRPPRHSDATPLSRKSSWLPLGLSTYVNPHVIHVLKLSFLLGVLALALHYCFFRSVPRDLPAKTQVLSYGETLDDRLFSILAQTNALSQKQQQLEAQNHDLHKTLSKVSALVEQLRQDDSRQQHLYQKLSLSFQQLLHSVDQQVIQLDEKFKTYKVQLNSHCNEKLQVSVNEKYFDRHHEALDPAWLNLHHSSKEELVHIKTTLQDLYKAIDLDKTAKVDWAQVSLGASIDEQFTSLARSTNFWNNLKWMLIFFFPRFYGKAQPRSHPVDVIIGGLGSFPLAFPSKNGITPGRCFAFDGQKGNVTLRLPTLVHVTEVHLDHPSPELLPSFSSAPHHFNVYIDDCLKDNCLKRLHFLSAPSKKLGTFTFTYPHPISQSFFINASNDFPSTVTHRIRFEFIQNYGAPYTCIYRLRVHGRQVTHQEYNKVLKSTR